MAVIVLSIMIFFVALGMPIAFTLLAASVGGMLIAGYDSYNIIPIMLFDGVNSFPLIAIPLFALMGQIMTRTSLGVKIVNLASALVGFIKGGLAMVTVVACMFFAELSGSAVAGAAALGSILIPQMEKRGYPKNFAAAVTSSASTLAIIIPPSTSLILYGVMAAVSIPKLFIAGIIPGLLTGGAAMVVSYVYAKKNNFPVEEKFQFKKLALRIKEGIWALIIPLVILGGIFLGVFTPTEAAGISVVIAAIVGWKDIKIKELPDMFFTTAYQTAIITIIVSISYLLGYFFTNEQIPQTIAAAVLTWTSNKIVILMIINVLLLFIGCILHGSAAIVMVTPLMLPLLSKLGIDPIHFGILLTLNLGIGQQTPPVASVLLTVCSISHTSIEEVFKPLKWFLLSSIIVLLFVTYVPILSLFLPRLVG